MFLKRKLTVYNLADVKQIDRKFNAKTQTTEVTTQYIGEGKANGKFIIYAINEIASKQPERFLKLIHPEENKEKIETSEIFENCFDIFKKHFQPLNETINENVVEIAFVNELSKWAITSDAPLENYKAIQQILDGKIKYLSSFI